ncbi:hypothetical protein [Williamsia sterculiae]|uniref:Uncharacterized protein n=1 Tax=Williamsia sterculiae TaxID=1344003 RepID=A0A1N7HEQ0_9NOCA|nr:hypothetical protein [Williamsia sterculiae]SIS23188.1 hypothetical protein SAMN05445060_4073 [Williamsia sterculiae]
MKTLTTGRRQLAGAVAALGIGAAVVTGAVTVGAGTASANPGYPIGSATLAQCQAKAANNAAYYHSHGGGGWDYTCWPAGGQWFYTSPYAA